MTHKLVTLCVTSHLFSKFTVSNENTTSLDAYLHVFKKTQRRLKKTATTMSIDTRAPINCVIVVNGTSVRCQITIIDYTTDLGRNGSITCEHTCWIPTLKRAACNLEFFRIPCSAAAHGGCSTNTNFRNYSLAFQLLKKRHSQFNLIFLIYEPWRLTFCCVLCSKGNLYIFFFFGKKRTTNLGPGPDPGPKFLSWAPTGLAWA